ncbi:hypothetical protein IH980_00115 [Patescibacteria group bacterium]|nr:hypothetical protein [Patescibacteria group bacterium]
MHQPQGKEFGSHDHETHSLRAEGILVLAALGFTAAGCRLLVPEETPAVEPAPRPTAALALEATATEAVAEILPADLALMERVRAEDRGEPVEVKNVLVERVFRYTRPKRDAIFAELAVEYADGSTQAFAYLENADCVKDRLEAQGRLGLEEKSGRWRTHARMDLETQVLSASSAQIPYPVLTLTGIVVSGEGEPRAVQVCEKVPLAKDLLEDPYEDVKVFLEDLEVPDIDLPSVREAGRWFGRTFGDLFRGIIEGVDESGDTPTPIP